MNRKNVSPIQDNGTLVECDVCGTYRNPDELRTHSKIVSGKVSKTELTVSKNIEVCQDKRHCNIEAISQLILFTLKGFIQEHGIRNNHP